MTIHHSQRTNQHATQIITLNGSVTQKPKGIHTHLSSWLVFRKQTFKNLLKNVNFLLLTNFFGGWVGGPLDKLLIPWHHDLLMGRGPNAKDCDKSCSSRSRRKLMITYIVEAKSWWFGKQGLAFGFPMGACLKPLQFLAWAIPPHDSFFTHCLESCSFGCIPYKTAMTRVVYSSLEISPEGCQKTHQWVCLKITHTHMATWSLKVFRISCVHFPAPYFETPPYL